MGNANADPGKTERKSAGLSCSAVTCWLLTVLIKAGTAAVFLLLWALLQLIFTRYYVPAFGFLRSASGIPAVLFAVGTLIPVLVYLFLIWVQPGRAKFRTSARNAGDGREPALIWSPDRPLTDPRHDALAYAEPARNLAESICSIVPEEGIVIAVCGPWGVGKTTFINFVEHFIGDGSRSRRPTILHFNPWWFSGRDDLVRRFFAELEVFFVKWQAKTAAISAQLARFAEAIGESPIPYASIGKALSKLLGIKPKDVVELKSRPKQTLSKQEPVLVMMDDIDRLTSDEIRDLFRLLKAVGDLPNILYMISMDRDMVVKALGDVQGTPGDSYLEKIVQYSFDLPQPDKLLLRQLLFARLDDVLAGMTEDEFDRTYYSNVYYEGIDHFITRPRDVVRLCNSLIVAYPAVKSEINAVDLIAIESLRVFQPSVYSILRSNPEMFAGHSGNLYRGSSGGIEEFHNAWLETIDDNDRKPVKRMMIRLFPKLEIVWGNDHHYGPDWEATWRKERRVCSPEVFPIYFRMATPSGSISNAEMKAMLKLIATPEAFAERLKDLAKQTLPSGRTRVRAFLELLPDYVDEYISGSAVQRFVNVVFAVGDDLQKQEDEVGMFEVGNGIRILRVVFQLLKPLSEEERYSTLLAAISQGKALTTMIRVVASLLKERAEQGKEPAPEEDVFLTEEHQESLKSVLLEKIRTAVAANSYVLFSHPDILWTLHRWKDWAGVAEPRKWVQDCIADDGWLMLLLAHSVQIGSRQSIDDVVPTPTAKLDAEWLSDFLDPSAIADRLRNILADQGVPSGSGAERAMRLFIASCEGTDQDD